MSSQVESKPVQDTNVSDLIKRVNRALKGNDEGELFLVRVKLVDLRDILATGHQEPVRRMIRSVDRRIEQLAN